MECFQPLSPVLWCQPHQIKIKWRTIDATTKQPFPFHWQWHPSKLFLSFFMTILATTTISPSIIKKISIVPAETKFVTVIARHDVTNWAVCNKFSGFQNMLGINCYKYKHTVFPQPRHCKQEQPCIYSMEIQVKTCKSWDFNYRNLFFPHFLRFRRHFNKKYITIQGF